MNRIAIFTVLLISFAAPPSAYSQVYLESDSRVSVSGSQTLLSTESGASAWLGITNSHEFAPPGWTPSGRGKVTCDKTLPPNPADSGVLHCSGGYTSVIPYVDANRNRHTLVQHIGNRMRPTAIWIDGVAQKFVDVTPPALAASDAVLIDGEDYIVRQINCDGDHIFVDGRWRADGTTEIPSLGGPLIMHCGLPRAPRFGPPEVYLGGRSPHPSGEIARATERTVTTRQVGQEASAPSLWYMIHPGGLAGVSHWAACGGVIFVALDDAAPSLAGTRWQDWTAEGPFKDKQACEGLVGEDSRGGAVCVPEDDPRIDPDIGAIAHFPSDAATGRIIFPPDFESRYATRLLTPEEEDRPCLQGSRAPWGLVRLKGELEQARAAAAQSMDHSAAPPQ